MLRQESSRHHSSRVTTIRRIELRGGASLLAFMIAVGPVAAETYGNTNGVFLNPGPVNGQDAYTSGILFWKKYHAATAGKDGPALDVTTYGAIRAIDPYEKIPWKRSIAPALVVGSEGGKGGAGLSRGYQAAEGGAGKNVTVTNSAEIALSTKDSDKNHPTALVLIYSHGGKGGAGIVQDGSYDPEEGYTPSQLYASGGRGGDAGAVTFTSSTGIRNEGDYVAALSVSSKGGNGGDNGTVDDDQVQAEGYGHGGAAGLVTVKIARGADIRTIGSQAAGIVVESVGGNGSDSANAYDTRGAAGGNPYASDADRRSIIYNNSAKVTTVRDYAPAVVLQSIGGAGGKGGTTGVSGRGTAGGAGGNGGDVDAVQFGAVTTSGRQSYGLVVQSVGGAGGNGGPGIASGGGGGAAGSGGKVKVAVNSTIATTGEDAAAVVAQSVGGGRALLAFQPDLIAPAVGGGGLGGGSFGLWIGTGGIGGTGGAGGETTVNNLATVRTAGAGATGILAQSIGGGGGGGGTATVLGLLFSVARGGASGGGGDGGTVTVTNRWGYSGIDGGVFTTGSNAAGILAQSIGGGGGSGGAANALTAGAVVSSATALGGSGGGGGKGGEVNVDTNAAVSTQGVRAHGIEAMSIGGGGGDGGASYAVAYAQAVDKRVPNIAVGVALGGSGGGGGNGGTVTVKNSGTVGTTGKDAFGIMGLSVGGGGGDGGISDIYAKAGGDSVVGVAVTVGVGGTGGGGGTGGTVTVTNDGTVTTAGDQAVGIVGYSVGGGGGAGGSADVTGSASGKAVSVAVNVAVGGKGGGGNTGGKVEIKNNGKIETQGYAASGIHALSVGGGGGNGGAGTAQSGTSGSKFVPGSSKISTVVDVGVGGAGGGGSNGGVVEVTNSKSITTHGVDARGIIAQSIGGGGGTGGTGTAHSSDSVQVNVGVGAKGGGASDGGTATVKNLSTGAVITTFGSGAYGIQAQSIGGGGGSGGSGSADAGESTVALLGKTLVSNGLKALAQKVLPRLMAKHSIKPEFPISVSGNATVGGAGGSGGNGKTVTVTNEAAIDTYGQVASAIYAQSIGGGGGDAGAATVGGGALVNLMKIASGGDGGAAGNGGTVKVTNAASGKITTAGDTAFGILAQSVGGGGGLSTLGVDRSGYSLDKAALTTGGRNGASGDGSDVTVTNAGSITTAGAEAHGIVAQSIGGGGGLVVLNSTDSASILELKKLTADEKATLKRYGVDVDRLIKEAEDARKTAVVGTDTLTLQLGATNKAKGDADKVTIAHSGSIATSGADAFGIVAQSIGGGGGLLSDGGGSSTAKLTVSGRLGGSSDSKGNGSKVEVKLGNASITTTGVGAIGLFAQSIGGGGGYTGALKSSAATYQNLLATDKPSTGTGGGILIKMDDPTQSMSITTKGKNAHGIFAQSVGGGGGAVGTADGIVLPQQIGTATGRTKASQGGGLIEMTLKGTIKTQGADAVGIYAQSGAQGNSGRVVAGTGSDISVVFDGTLQGGSGSGAAVQLDGGAANTIEFRPDSEVGALSGVAVLATSGTETLQNFGTLTGDVNLAVGGTGEANSFINEVGGTYVSSARGVVNMGTAGSFKNEGTFNIGGTKTFATATVTGAFSQTGAGALLMDVSRTAAATSNDVLRVTGKATIDGTIRVNVVDGLMPGRFGVMELGGAQSTVTARTAGGTFSPFSWSVQRDGSTVFLTPTANIAAPKGADMSQSEDGTMAKLQASWTSGHVSADEATLFAKLANVSSAQDYKNSIDSMTPEESASVATSQTLNAMTSMKMALSCPVFAGSGALMEETSCAWARVIGNWTQQTSSAEASGYQQSAITYRLGAQKEIATDWFLGATAGLTQSWLSDTDGLSNTDGISGDVAVSLKRQLGPWLFAVSGHLGYGAFDTARLLDVGPSQWHTSGTSNVLTAAARLRASYEFAAANWYLKPFADVDLIYTRMPGYTEEGVGGMNLYFDTAQQWNVAVSPQLEIGARVDIDPQMWLRPYASTGVSFFAKDSMDIGVSLGNAPSLAPDFIVQATIPSTLVNVTAGVQLVSTAGYELRGEYKADFGDNYTAQEASFRFALPF
ncbi:hypothetical protein [Xanthobacter sediminis]